MSRKNTQAQPLRVLSITPIAAACAALLWGGAVSAQDKNNTVIVPGIRGAIESALAIKRDSDSIVEAVTAEDIGKLPDVSIAESIASLPGLTAQRVEGRAQVISLRGLGPDFTGTLMNGRELVSTSNNRGAEYDQYPSELMSGVTVYKTPDASLAGQGLAGTVNLQTVHPLDRRGRAMVINGRVEKNGNGKLNPESSAWGQRMNFAYIDQFMNNTLGVALGFAHLSTPGQQQEYKAWYWANKNALGTGNSDVVALQGAEVTDTSRKQVRDGMMAVLDYKPSREFRSTLDLYYSEFDKTDIMRGAMWNSNPGSNVTYQNPQIDTFGDVRLLTGGTLGKVEPIVRNDRNTRKDRVGAFGWNNRYLAGKWELVSDLSYSQARRHEQVLETYSGLGVHNKGNTDNNFQFEVPVEDGIPKFTPSLDLANPNLIKLVDVAGWGKDADMHRPKVADTLSALQLTARRELDGFFSYVQAGTTYKQRDKTHSDINNYYFLKNGRVPAVVTPDLIEPSASLSFGGIPAVLTYDTMAVLAKYYDQQPARTADMAIQNWSVDEKVTTSFAKLGIDTGLGPVPVRGNLGVQVVNVNQSSEGVAVAGATITQLHGGKSYRDVLPNLNLNFDLGHFVDSTSLRFGAAKAMARPQMQDMRAGASGSISDKTREWSGSGGNPGLEPWRANSFDLSLEKYIGKRSYVAVAAFYKNLTNYIYNQQTKYDFTGFPTQSTTIPISEIGTMNRPANGQGGMVKGAEVAGALEGGLLWRALDGFGVIGSTSRTKSSIHPDGPGTSKTLPGMSGSVFSLALYYEKDGFQARISERYRASFRGEVTGLFALRTYSEILAERTIALQTGYSFQKGDLKGLSVLLQVNNLNNSPYQTRQGSPFASGAYAPERYTTYGRQVLLGLNYKL